MNHDHEEFIELINKIEVLLNDESNGKEQINALLSELQTHTVEHFAREEEAMQQYGFPPYQIHKMEHERVLLGLQQQIEQFQKSTTNDVLKRYVCQDIPMWFENHLGTMDTATANFISMQQ